MIEHGSAGLDGTHADGCHTWGRIHYGCALAVIGRLCSMLDEIATDLENEIENRRPCELRRRIERDLDVVQRARALFSAAQWRRGKDEP